MSSEQRGFVFSITFIIIFAALLAAIPAGLQGEGGTADTLLPVNPDLITDFSDSINFTRTSFTNYFYAYDLGGWKWRCGSAATQFKVDRKVLIAGILWLGQIKETEFVLDNGTNRGSTLTMSEIDGDDDDGTIRYDLEYTDSGEDAGGFVVYWNTTEYDNSTHAWDNDELHLLHGIGLGSSATANIAALLVSLLFLQLPNVPVLVNVLLATPIWACIVYILWYVIKETIPFV